MGRQIYENLSSISHFLVTIPQVQQAPRNSIYFPCDAAEAQWTFGETGEQICAGAILVIALFIFRSGKIEAWSNLEQKMQSQKSLFATPH